MGRGGKSVLKQVLNCCAITHKIQLISSRGELFALLCWMPSDHHSLHPHRPSPSNHRCPSKRCWRRWWLWRSTHQLPRAPGVPRKGIFLRLQQTLSPCPLRCEDALHQRPAHPGDHCSHKWTRASRLLLWFKTSCTQRGPWLGAAGSSSCKCYSENQGCVLDLPPPACSEFSSLCCQTQPQESFSRRSGDIPMIQVILNWTHRDIFPCKFTFKPGNLQC